MKKSLAQWSLRIIKTVLATVILAVLAIMLINAWDEPLSPKVAKILAAEPNLTERQTKAYFYLLGLTYGAEASHAEATGAELWKNRSSHPLWQKSEAHPPFEVQFPGCQGHICGIEQLHSDPNLKAELEKNKTLIQNYIGLLGYGEGGDLFEGSEDVPFNPVSGQFTSIHKLYLLQMADWLDKGGQERVFDELSLANHYMESYFHTGTLLQRSLALANMTANARFLSAELKRNPKLHVKQELLESFVIPDPADLAFGALEFDTRSFNYLLQSLKRHKLQDSDADGIFPTSRFATFFLRPKETLNHYYETEAQVLTVECPSRELSECFPALIWQEMHSPLKYLINPVGRTLLTSFQAGYLTIQAHLKSATENLRQLKEDMQSDQMP